MFKKINEGGVVGDNGFSIQIIGPEELEYKCMEKKLIIDLGYDSKKKTTYIYVNDITRWDNSNDTLDMSVDERDEIITNIKEAVKLLNGNFEVA